MKGRMAVSVPQRIEAGNQEARTSFLPGLVYQWSIALAIETVETIALAIGTVEPLIDNW